MAESERKERENEILL